MRMCILLVCLLVVSCQQEKDISFCDLNHDSYSVDTLKNIAYFDSLFLDIYQVDSTPTVLRPLILLTHGMGDMKESEDLTFHCDRLASQGYVVAAIGWSAIDSFSIDSSLYYQIGVQPIVDFQKAFQYFLDDARAENQYQIDTNQLFVGGSSFGAITALHIAYADSLDQFPIEFRESLQLAGLNNTTWKDHQQRINGVVNLSGWVWDTSYIDTDDPAIISIHGETDALTPFQTDTASIDTIPIMMVSGPGSIHQRMELLDVPNDLFIIPKGGHVAYFEPAWRDSSASRIAAFLGDIICN